MTPLTTEQRRRLLDNPPPEREDEFPHLAELSPEKLIERRWQIAKTLKALEAERREIDSLLTAIYSAAEFRQGIRVLAGWTLRQKSRTSWRYDPEVQERIKRLQQQAQSDGRAQELVTTFLSFTPS